MANGSVVNNPYLNCVKPIPSWSKAKNSRAQKSYELLDALKQVGTSNSIILTKDQVKADFPNKYSLNGLKTIAKKLGMRLKIVEHGNEICFCHSMIAKPLYKEVADGVHRIAE
jgi:hypothetical protein